MARDASTWGVILGTLGRQGNPAIFNRIRQLLTAKGKRAIPFLMAEVLPTKLNAIAGIDVTRMHHNNETFVFLIVFLPLGLGSSSLPAFIDRLGRRICESKMIYL